MKIQIAAIIKRGFLRNSVLSGAQAIIASIVMFFSYRLLLHEVGLERVGLWSLLVAITSVARVADVTGAGGLARFVSKALSNENDAAIYVHTLTISVCLLYIALSAVVFVVSEPLLFRLVEPENLEEGLTLMPIAILSGLIFTPIAAVLASGVDGAHRADQRAVLVTTSYLLFVSIAYSTVPKYGVVAWGIAMIVQQVIVIVGSWILLRRHIGNLGFFPNKWSPVIFFETVQYGLKIQANSIAGLFSEPLTKIILNRFGGLEAVALYELSLRLVMAIRGVIVQMAMPLIPEFANSYQDRDKCRVLLARSVRMTALGTSAGLCLVLLGAPGYSYFMLGEFQLELVLIVGPLAVGYAINTLSVPYYFAGLGLNWMRWNIGSQFFMAASIIILGSTFGSIFGTAGVVSATVLGLIGGAAMVAIGNSRAINLPGKNRNFRKNSN